MNKKEKLNLELKEKELKREEARVRLLESSKKDIDDVVRDLNTSVNGLRLDKIEKQREQYGMNKVDTGEDETFLMRIKESFLNPFTIILLGLAGVSYITDVTLASPGQKDYMTVGIILVMVLISGVLKLVQESKSQNAANKLSEMVQNTTLIKRQGVKEEEIPMEEVVVGDINYISAGDMIPADMRIIEAKDLFISQASLTGESESIEKFSHKIDEIKKGETLTEINNLVFMGSTVVSGSAKGVVIATGNDTMFGSISESITDKPTKTTFEEGVDSVSWLLIRFMLIMVPIVFVINGITKGNWLDALLFSISIAVGLTPEMLPMIVTTTLAKGAVSMSKEKTIVKDLSSIQNLGSMDILCTDKTGTLTQDRVVLEYHLDVDGNDEPRVLRHAFLNSYYQTGLKNLMDKSIIERTKIESQTIKSLQGLSTAYTKVDEVPFDFNRRRMSVVVEDKTGKTQMITKGAVEEMLSICSFVELEGEVLELKEEIIDRITKTVVELNSKGMRVIAVAQKTNPSPVGHFSVKDESDMVLMGYLAFLDPPKDSAEEAILTLKEYGVTTKVLTGDNELVTESICDMIGIDTTHVLLGSDIEGMSDGDLAKQVEEVNVFAKLSPTQKSRVVRRLRDNGHTVGFLGDGINDAPAMKEADIGISVDNAVDIAKESAEVILLEKDLGVLEKGIVEGRKTYANMIKYIKMTASSNFGNVFSVLLASAFLPFLPMEPTHLILLNLIYDISCIGIPWDNVDEYYLKVPRKWEASSIRDFMLIIGPTSSVFDVTTYLLMFFIIAPQVVGMPYSQVVNNPTKLALFVAVFQAGWFIESMWSQTLVVHMLRTKKVSFIESNASMPLFVLTTIGIIIATIIPFTPFGIHMDLAPLPGNYFIWLGVTIVLYMALASWAKNIFVKKYGELL